MLHNIMWTFWNIFSQTKYAELATEPWDAQVQTIRRILLTPGGRWFWDNYEQEFELSFRHEVNRVLEQSHSQGAGEALWLAAKRRSVGQPERRIAWIPCNR